MGVKVVLQGSYSQVDMEDINLHFTGDIHAITQRIIPYVRLSITISIREYPESIPCIYLNVVWTLMTERWEVIIGTGSNQWSHALMVLI